MSLSPAGNVPLAGPINKNNIYITVPYHPDAAAAPISYGVLISPKQSLARKMHIAHKGADAALFDYHDGRYRRRKLTGVNHDGEVVDYKVLIGEAKAPAFMAQVEGWMGDLDAQGQQVEGWVEGVVRLLQAQGVVREFDVSELVEVLEGLGKKGGTGKKEEPEELDYFAYLKGKNDGSLVH